MSFLLAFQPALGDTLPMTTTATNPNHAQRRAARKAVLHWMAEARKHRAGTRERQRALANANAARQPLAVAGPGDFIGWADDLPLEIVRVTRRTVYVRSHYWTREPGKPRSSWHIFEMLMKARRKARDGVS